MPRTLTTAERRAYAALARAAARLRAAQAAAKATAADHADVSCDQTPDTQDAEGPADAS